MLFFQASLDNPKIILYNINKINKHYTYKSQNINKARFNKKGADFMRRYPPPRSTQPIVDSAGLSVILTIITVCCPPLGLVAYILAGICEEIGLKIGK